ncbi:hypothetical protein SR42_12470 [Clostridium botulinum]|uniref:hypothetical protein n=1 Tax=Clostridium TaxID=1485 RepID=UPI000597E860|nr:MULTISPECIES: hypothetical protein [Clostridium]KIL07018.1 hypothetical protein SR42_12470 [Clostridium botulinum]
MGGVVLDSSGVGAVAGVPLNISGLAVAADGVINAERSLTSLANDTMSLIYSKSSNGGSGKSGSNETSHVQSSEISEKAIKSIKKKWGQKGVDAFEKAMNKGIVGAEGQNGIKSLKGKPYKGKYTHEIKVKNKEYVETDQSLIAEYGRNAYNVTIYYFCKKCNKRIEISELKR